MAVATISFTNAQNVNIPDNNFKALSFVKSPIKKRSDTETSISEAAAYSGSFFCQKMSIQDMTGVEAFPNIKRIMERFTKQ